MSASRKSIGSDFAKVDAYQNTAADYEELPEITDADLARAKFLENGVPRRGRPPIGDRPKKAVSLRLDQDVVDHFRSRGAGWQTRINAILADVAERERVGGALAVEAKASASK